MNNGWIKLYRSLLKWEWWDDQSTTRLWLTILLLANHDDEKWHGQIIKAGSFITSLQTLSTTSGLSIQAVRTGIKKLESTGEIISKSTNRNRLITVVKWADFQMYDKNQQANNKQATSKQQASNNQVTTNKNIKNDKKEKNIRNIFRKPTLEEVRSYIQNNNLNVDAEYFYDYYESNGWKVGGKASMKSWQSTLNNWNRRDKKKQEDMPF